MVQRKHWTCSCCRNIAVQSDCSNHLFRLCVILVKLEMATVKENLKNMSLPVIIEAYYLIHHWYLICIKDKDVHSTYPCYNDVTTSRDVGSMMSSHTPSMSHMASSYYYDNII